MSAEIDELIMTALCVSPLIAVLSMTCWTVLPDQGDRAK